MALNASMSCTTSSMTCGSRSALYISRTYLRRSAGVSWTDLILIAQRLMLRKTALIPTSHCSAWDLSDPDLLKIVRQRGQPIVGAFDSAFKALFATRFLTGEGKGLMSAVSQVLKCFFSEEIFKSNLTISWLGPA